MYVTGYLIDYVISTPYSINGNEIHTTNIDLGKNFVDIFYLEDDMITIENDSRTLVLKRLYDYPAIPLKERLFNRNVSFSDSVLFVHYQRMFALREAEYECADN